MRGDRHTDQRLGPDLDRPGKLVDADRHAIASQPEGVVIAGTASSQSRSGHLQIDGKHFPEHVRNGRLPGLSVLRHRAIEADHHLLALHIQGRPESQLGEGAAPHGHERKQADHRAVTETYGLIRVRDRPLILAHKARTGIEQHVAGQDAAGLARGSTVFRGLFQVSVAPGMQEPDIAETESLADLEQHSNLRSRLSSGSWAFWAMWNLPHAGP